MTRIFRAGILPCVEEESRITILDQGGTSFNPLDFDKRKLKYKVLATRKKDAETAAKWGKDLVAKVNDPVLLDAFASDLLANDAFGPDRDLKLALEAARKANDLAKGQDWSILATLAGASLANKDTKAAQDAAKKALALAKKAGVEGDDLKEREAIAGEAKGSK